MVSAQDRYFSYTDSQLRNVTPIWKDIKKNASFKKQQKSNFSLGKSNFYKVIFWQKHWEYL